MTLLTLEHHQVKILEALRALDAHLGWMGEELIIDSTLVYQFPEPNDPDISGVLFMSEADEPNIRLYLTLPWNVQSNQIARASEFVIRYGFGLRFGALEFDLDHGSLRVRMDADVVDDTYKESIIRLLDRAVALGREVSPKWRSIVCEVVAM